MANLFGRARLDFTDQNTITPPSGTLTVAGAEEIIGQLYANGGVAVANGAITAGADGVTNGTITLWDGSGGNTPGYVKCHSANGTAWYLFVEDDGTVKVHNAVPTANCDGSEVGGQS